VLRGLGSNLASSAHFGLPLLGFGLAASVAFASEAPEVYPTASFAHIAMSSPAFQHHEAFSDDWWWSSIHERRKAEWLRDYGESAGDLLLTLSRAEDTPPDLTDRELEQAQREALESLEAARAAEERQARLRAAQHRVAIVPPDQLTAMLAAAFPDPADAAVAHRIVRCESSANAAANTGNGYYGMWQFDLATWQAVGGAGLPSDASPQEQTARARKLFDLKGWWPWSGCL
jgi:hypothetical protein